MTILEIHYEGKRLKRREGCCIAWGGVMVCGAFCERASKKLIESGVEETDELIQGLYRARLFMRELVDENYEDCGRPDYSKETWEREGGWFNASIYEKK